MASAKKIISKSVGASNTADLNCFENSAAGSIGIGK